MTIRGRPDSRLKCLSLAVLPRCGLGCGLRIRLVFRRALSRGGAELILWGDAALVVGRAGVVITVLFVNSKKTRRSSLQILGDSGGRGRFMAADSLGLNHEHRTLGN